MNAVPAAHPAAAWGSVRPGYLDAATMGIPTLATVEAMRAATEEWAAGEAVAAGYGVHVDRARSAFARLVGAPVEHVAIGATVAEHVGLVAAALPDGADVVTVDGDFSSVVYPFLQHAHRGVTVRHVPLEGLAESIRPGTALVAFSLIQSADGRVADLEAIAAAAAGVGARTLCDATQAVGLHPVDAARWDYTVCHSYKWLCAPRGASFLVAAPDAADRLVALHACWYGGEEIWASTYGPSMRLADTTRRLDTSPAWLSWVGAAEAIEHFAERGAGDTWARSVALADALLSRAGLPPRGQAFFALDDPSGALAGALREAGIRFAQRAGRVRLGFHVWNTDEDLELAAAAFAAAGLRAA
ncbi:MAG: aminotransferase class V-fold PLP-dependent enzyme [Microbacteriaceae bacterium]|nr:aminotransferase class V-fold PLP-dependent enzyme [Microbacteriaceae bacterium]